MFKNTGQQSRKKHKHLLIDQKFNINYNTKIITVYSDTDVLVQIAWTVNTENVVTNIVLYKRILNSNFRFCAFLFANAV